MNIPSINKKFTLSFHFANFYQKITYGLCTVKALILHGKVENWLRLSNLKGGISGIRLAWRKLSDFILDSVSNKVTFREYSISQLT